MNPSNEVTERERALFEMAFADKLDFLRLSPDAEYFYSETGHAWDGWQARASLPQPSAEVVVGGRRMIPDTECIQSKCACATTGCWGECSMRRNPVMFAGQPTLVFAVATQPAPEMQASHGAVVVSPAPSAALLKTGAKMANVMYNLAQQQGSVLTEEYCAGMSVLCKKWDAERRAAPSADSAADARDAWIAIEDKYPKRGESVLVLVGGQVGIGGYSDREAGPVHGWWFTGVNCEDDDALTHWQPVPEPPIAAIPAKDG